MKSMPSLWIMTLDPGLFGACHLLFLRKPGKWRLEAGRTAFLGLTTARMEFGHSRADVACVSLGYGRLWVLAPGSGIWWRFLTGAR